MAADSERNISLKQRLVIPTSPASPLIHFALIKFDREFSAVAGATVSAAERRRNATQLLRLVVHRAFRWLNFGELARDGRRKRHSKLRDDA